MGQTLSEPVTEKHVVTGENDTVCYAITDMQGWRISMEDAHSAVIDVQDQKGKSRGSFFAVYDGHGGSTVAQYCGETMFQRLTGLDAFQQGQYKEALTRAFLQTDEELLTDPNHVNDPSGCTAVAAFIETEPENPKKVKTIYVANAGDSRSVMSDAGRAEPLSFDHKPTDEGEHARISRAGGYVSWGRVNGNLALSRAIGDFEFKRNEHMRADEQIVTANPDVSVTTGGKGEEFVVIACDGIWDCLSSQDVIDVTRRSVANGKELKDICEDLMNMCLAPDSDTGGIGCDNMTVCIVALLNGRTKQEWYDWIKKNVEDSTGYQTPEQAPIVFKTPSRQPAQEDGQGQGTVSIQSLLSGGSQGEEDGGDESGSALRLPGGLAGALSGAGIVFRPGGTSQGGEVVYEAHVVDEDDSDDNESADKPAEPELVESPRPDAKSAPSNKTQTMDVDKTT